MLFYLGGFLLFLVGVWVVLKPKKKTISWKNVSKPASTVEEVEKLLEKVSQNKEKWTKVSYSEKLRYLKSMLQSVDVLQEEWSELNAKVRLYDTPELKGVAGLFGPGMLGSHLNNLVECYESLVKTGKLPAAVSEREFDGQKIVQVYPRNLMDKVLKAVVSGELWLQPGKEASQGKSLEEKPGLVAVLGAGNFEAPLDILNQMFLHNKVVVFKSHPMNAASVDAIFPRLLHQLISDGYLGLCSGGPEIGQALIHHELVEEGMMTGGCLTFDRIVWGDPEEQKVRKENNEPVFDKPITAELGAVSPWIVVPGKWTEKEIDHQAQLLVAAKNTNAGAICASPQVVILDKDWDQAEQFAAKVKEIWESWPDFKHYYVGTLDRESKFQNACSNAIPLKKDNTPELVKPLLIPAVDKDSTVLKTEAFAPVLAFYHLSTKGNPEQFLKKAVEEANETLFGSLSCTLIIDPTTEKANKASLEKAIKSLKWGTIGVNDWAANANLFGFLRWGAAPGLHSLEDIQSGIGEIGNYSLFDNVEKTVLRSEFNNLAHMKKPSKKSAKMYSRLTNFNINPTWGNLLTVIGAVVLGL